MKEDLRGSVGLKNKYKEGEKSGEGTKGREERRREGRERRR